MRIRAQEPGCLTVLSRCEKAVPGLEGGLVSLPEGLEEKGGPCTKVLSVAGFFTLKRGFPGSGRFILGRKRASFPS